MALKFRSLIIIIQCIVTVPIAVAESLNVESTDAISIFLVNAEGEHSSTLGVIKGHAIKDIIFKHRVGAEIPLPSSWALEISEPVENLFGRVLADGKLPTLLHWDGKFDAATSIGINKKYFIRLLLIMKDNKAYASPWASFQTRLKNPYEGKKTSGNFIDLYVVPSGAVHSVFIKTKSFRTLQFPSFFGDVRCIWKNDHTFGLRLETTSNIFSNYEVSSAGFFYSDFSLFYRYRLIGAPIRAPNLPYFPPYAGKKVVLPSVNIEAYAKPRNFEVGARIFSSVIRGYSNTVIESELARSLMGATLTARFDQAFGPVRAHAAVEGGYSLFRSRLLMGSLEGTVTYEGIANVSPGIQSRLQIIKGTVPEAVTGSEEEISNQLIFTGVVLYFKI